ncbi:MAG TPA: AMP-binding protein, partial [Pseudonocardia sp.]|nr:AMP-binding protein [Pseudonocardia sp.]
MAATESHLATSHLSARGMTASDQLSRHARKIGDDVALRFDDSGRTYRELDERVTRLANALRARGVGVGDRVAVLGLNSIELIESYLASVRLGAIGVPINFRLAPPEVGYALADSGAVAAVVDSTFAGLLAAAREHAPALRGCLVIGGGP